VQDTAMTQQKQKEDFSVQNVEEKWFILILKTLIRNPVLTVAKKHYLNIWPDAGIKTSPPHSMLKIY
jgi:hypothetical protein